MWYLQFDVLPYTVFAMSKAERPRYLDGAALRRSRLAAGLEQSQLAERAKVTQGQISGWERGHTGCRIGTLHRLASALGIDPSELLLRDDAEDAGSTSVPEPKGAAA